MKKATSLLCTAALIIAIAGCAERGANQEAVPAADSRTAIEREADELFAAGRQRVREGVWFGLGATDTFEFTDEHYRASLADVNLVPREVLQTMSTEGLIETAFNFPWLTLRMNISNSSALNGARNVFELDVFRELFTRDDAASALVQIYNGISLDDIYRNDVYTDALADGFYDVFTLELFEYLLTQEAVMNQFTEAEKAVIIETAVSLMEEAATGDEGAVHGSSRLFLCAQNIHS
jgi:hypothetical protein